MPRLKTENLTVWAAAGEDGKVLVSSISAYRSVAARWAMKYRNHAVVSLCEVPRSKIKEEPQKVETKPEPEPKKVEIAKPILVQHTGKNGKSLGKKMPWRKRVAVAG